MRKARVEQERLGLAEFVEHAVDEAQEHGSVHAHRAGGVEQYHQPQRLVLALAFDQRNRHAAMADVAMDGTAEIEAMTTATREIAAGQPRAHHPRETCRGLMRLRHLLRVRELA